MPNDRDVYYHEHEVSEVKESEDPETFEIPCDMDVYTFINKNGIEDRRYKITAKPYQSGCF